MSLLAWVCFGFITGFIASKVLKTTRHGVVLGIVLGIVGAAMGGSLFATIGMDGSFLVVVSAALLLTAVLSVSRGTR